MLHASHNGDHPRVCGKDAVEAANNAKSTGSPPRMRERLKNIDGMRPLFRITPAYAGKTTGALRNCTRPQDHPRVCGKDPTLIARVAWNLGSPPRMRERLLVLGIVFSFLGITPAYAGKTPVALVVPATAWDHPRVCGKDGVLRSRNWMSLGSPPRMRERLGAYVAF